jgi:ABC-type multidrug transport system fused ATPase/permease subunit
VLYSLALAAGFGLTAAALTWLGAREVMAGRLTVGQLLVFIGYLTQLYEPLNQLSHVGATVSDASAGTQRVLELLDTPREVDDNPDTRPVVSVTDPATTRNSPTPPLRISGNIVFDKVSFAYEPRRLVLHNVAVAITAGESVALLGPSGAGKTTLLQLLPRFYDPTDGAVTFEGVDLRALRLRDLRQQIALVPQEPILLLASIAENIAYGRPGASRAEIEAAARAANADAFIAKLPRQYDTIVGEGAARLSAGEKQRINIARAFLKNAPILLLDEPTSALDVESEELVVASLDRLMANRTALLVAHRLSTIRKVDRIVVLDGGRIIESGSPDKLRHSGGYYSRVAANAGI